MLERNNKALGANNEVIIIDNVVFHDKIRHVKAGQTSSPLCEKVATTSHPSWK